MRPRPRTQRRKRDRWSASRSSRHTEQDAVALQPDWHGARAALVRIGSPAVGEADDPVMQRAGDGVSVHDALGEFAALMWAGIVEREDAVVMRAEDRHRATRCRHG